MKPSSKRGIVLAVAAALMGAALLLLGLDLVRHPERHPPGAAAVLRIAALAACAAACGLLALRGRALLTGARPGEGIGRPLRGFLHAPFLAFLLTTLVRAATDPAAQALGSIFFSLVALAQAAWAVLVLFRFPAVSGPSPGGRRVEIVLINALATLLLVESALVLLARYSPAPLLWEASSPSAVIAAHRGRPRSRHRGFPMNAQGFHDTDFFPAGPDDEVIAVLGDSFAFGVVPREENFITLAEQELRAARPGAAGRLALHNFGIPNVGLPEYTWLLHHEVLGYRPSRVVVCLFVGNDLQVERRRRRRAYGFQDFHLYDLGHRALTLIRYRPGGLDAQPPSRASSSGGGIAPSPLPPTPAPDLPVVPTLTREDFLAVEQSRLEICRVGSGAPVRPYPEAEALLAALHRQLGETLLVVIIPDQFQVDDALYREIISRLPAGSAADHRRDAPQERLREFFSSRGIRFVDLLPPLRRAAADAPVHAPQDTHWNARGNRVAAQALADALRSGAPANRAP